MVGDLGVLELSELISGGGCPRLLQLSLSFCGVGDVGMKALAQVCGPTTPDPSDEIP
jgi:hypothetical protein